MITARYSWHVEISREALERHQPLDVLAKALSASAQRVASYVDHIMFGVMEAERLRVAENVRRAGERERRRVSFERWLEEQVARKQPVTMAEINRGLAEIWRNPKPIPDPLQVLPGSPQVLPRSLAW